MNVNARYGFEIDDKVREFHKGRTMFAVINEELKIAYRRSADSHVEWFLKNGWMSEGDDSSIKDIIRGFVDGEGVYFYMGYDFSVSEDKEKEFVSEHLSTLADKLKLDGNLRVYSGMIKQDKPGKFPPRRCLGSIKKLLK